MKSARTATSDRALRALEALRRQALPATTALLICSTVFAGTTDAEENSELAELRAQIAALTERLDRLEKRGTSGAANTEAASTASVPRSRSARKLPDASVDPFGNAKLELGGDLRYRAESIKQEGQDSRQRHRIRARLSLGAAISDDLRLGFRINTGGSSPRTGMQSLDGGFSKKSLNIDQAYFDWAVTDSFRLTGGKMPNPMHRPGWSHLVWDDDISPEGLAMSYDSPGWFARLAGFSIEERSADEDSFMLAAQVALRGNLGPSGQWATGLSYYGYSRVTGETPFFDGAPQGNTLDAQGRYASDYRNIQWFGEMQFDLRGRPLRFFADAVSNRATESLNSGYSLGARYGGAAAPGDSEWAITYVDLDADAVLGTFTDGDFAGGGTGTRGFVVYWRHALRQNLSMRLRFFDNQREFGSVDPLDYRRFQADVDFKF